MGYAGIHDFTIVNQCGSTVTAVRITHFLKDYNAASELFIKESMNAGESAIHKFESRDGKNDNWTISFQTGNGCFMCGKIDKSMQKGRTNYKLLIQDHKFVFQYMEDGKVHEVSKDVESVYSFVS